MTQRPFYLPGSYLVLELSNACPLACVHCARADGAHSHYACVGHFPLTGLTSLLDDLERNQIRFDALMLFWLGEPLAHPDFIPLYSSLIERPGVERLFGQIEVHTNGVNLTSFVAAHLLNRRALPQRWHVTLDAASRETYLLTKGREFYDRVVSQLKQLLAFRQRGGFSRPQVVIQCIVSDRNEREIPLFVEQWQTFYETLQRPLKVAAYFVPQEQREDVVFLRSLDCPSSEEQARQDEVYQRTVARLGLDSADGASRPPPALQEHSPASRRSAACSGFFKSPVIGWDGRLTVCTRDSRFEHLLGNVLERPFSELYYGDGQIRAWRQSVLRGDYDELPLCQQCFIPRSNNYSGMSEGDLRRVREIFS